MMRILPTLLFFCELLLCSAQNPIWQWAKSAQETFNAEGSAVSTDKNGNVFITGYFGDSDISFDSFVLTNAGSNDVFIAKYDATGNVLWAKSAGGSLGERGLGIATDANGNVFVTGYFKSSSITFDTIELFNAGNKDIFIAKYDSSGNVQWVKSIGGNEDEEGLGICTDIYGNVFLTGYFGSSGISIDTTILTNSGISDIFLAKYDYSGNMLWAKSVGGADDERANGVSTDINGNVIVTGWFKSSIIFLDSDTLANAGDIDIFNIKYDTTGNIIWAYSNGGTGTDISYSITSDASGNFFLTGYFTSTSLTFGSTTLISGGIDRILIAKYDSSGNAIWAKRYGGNGQDRGLSISTDISGNIFVGGIFISSVLNLGSASLTNAGGIDAFIAKWDSSGSPIWAKSEGGAKYDYAFGVASDFNGSTFITGYFFSDTLTFDSTVLINEESNNFTNDMFLAKLDNLTGIVENSTKTNVITIYPNPGNGFFYLKLPPSISEFPSSIKIYNVLGEIVYEKSLTPSPLSLNRWDGEEAIDISKQPTGIYFYQINYGEKVLSGKLVIE